MFYQAGLNTHLFKLAPPTTIITRDEDANNSIIKYIKSILFIEKMKSRISLEEPTWDE